MLPASRGLPTVLLHCPVLYDVQRCSSGNREAEVARRCPLFSDGAGRDLELRIFQRSTLEEKEKVWLMPHFVFRTYNVSGAVCKFLEWCC